MHNLRRRRRRWRGKNLFKLLNVVHSVNERTKRLCVCVCACLCALLLLRAHNVFHMQCKWKHTQNEHGCGVKVQLSSGICTRVKETCRRVRVRSSTLRHETGRMANAGTEKLLKLENIFAANVVGSFDLLRCVLCSDRDGCVWRMGLLNGCTCACVCVCTIAIVCVDDTE